MEIIYDDQNIVVCVKPVGLDSQHQVTAVLKEQLSSDIYDIHRLDKNVSGLMVYARNKKTAALLSKAIQEGTMIKEYVAVVHGQPPQQGIWEDLLWKDSHKNKVYVVKRVRKGVKKAKLSFTTVNTGEKSCVYIRLYTGRSHQIRVQFASRGYPLVGDHKYGSHDKQKNPMLFSWRLTFPYQGKTVTFEKKPDWAGENGE